MIWQKIATQEKTYLNNHSTSLQCFNLFLLSLGSAFSYICTTKIEAYSLVSLNWLICLTNLNCLVLLSTIYGPWEKNLLKYIFLANIDIL